MVRLGCLMHLFSTHLYSQHGFSLSLLALLVVIVLVCSLLVWIDYLRSEHSSPSRYKLVSSTERCCILRQRTIRLREDKSAPHSHSLLRDVHFSASLPAADSGHERVLRIGRHGRVEHVRHSQHASRRRDGGCEGGTWRTRGAARPQCAQSADATGARRAAAISSGPDERGH